MSNDPTVRRILPHNPQMGAFTFAPPSYQQPRETQKNYVFVDEHNRHKRLKVMRACEGCRRRKIKCDAATTNTWPCAACVRLKLHCVRPNGYDGAAEPQVYEPPSQSQYDASSQAQDSFRQPLPLHEQQQQQQQQQQQLLAHAPKPPSIYTQSAYQDPAAMYHPVQYNEPQNVAHNLQYTAVHPAVSVADQRYPTQAAFPTPPLRHASQPESPEAYQSEYAQQDLADLLGSLKVNETGTAPYLNSKFDSTRDEEPALEDSDDYKSVLPPLVSGPGLKIRIPPELMPDDETVLHYFDLYFANAHPYVPVLDKESFYHQWQSNRESISPLLLEAIFAISGRLADEPAQGQQWIALATRHADSFMDVPRLSTLQALMILLKAREQAPKRGYYYRSWMSIVQCVQMGKDLGLDEHYTDHQAGRPCGASQSECRLKNRIWQTVFVCEVMIGSSQGRTDLQVDLDTVDFEVPRPVPNHDESEYHVSRNFTYLARVVRNVSKMLMTYGRLKKNKSKDWGIDPEFVQISPSLTAWLNELPTDMTVSYPADGSPPWLPSAFVGNLHSYYCLSIILFNRPQLAFMSPGGADGQWKNHMLVSYNAAKMLCRLQESVMGSYGLPGLQCMQRGINFTIYAVLACIVLHLVALTSPDPDLNSEARDFFTRHMRILEKCMVAWPMPDMQKQIDSVREAFSADIRKPFVLKPSFPYGSPHSSNPSPPGQRFRQEMPRAGLIDQQVESRLPHSQVSYISHPISPPVSASPLDSHSDSPGVQSMGMMPSGQPQVSGVQHPMTLTEAPAWNPTRIFDQWNTSFGAPVVQSPPNQVNSQDGSINVSPTAGSDPTALQSMQAAQAQLQSGPQQMPVQQYPAAQAFVTPAMWQESVASVYEGGLKRSWGDYDSHMPMKRRG
ncbi:hypothetical protein QBC34DRAFT_445679 [Podospora aff. communis PSN243]|uniref:Zn(2)-C6 fungal-type domain-containing protein n=1 Tax=Podospora aff. communis PSN243 TaxID=3040156 RepID=A0AAV9H1A9_9PEZI|nr:hypothetical protein QBC34DRAFT_445679 [Podospora aff. communis PSN243]